MPEAVDLVSRYKALNESFERRLFFHLGVNAGFFSEFNNMLLAMLYCLDRKIQFILYSADANFRVDRGWGDFFEPFCPETDNTFHHANNYRWLKWYHPLRKARIGIAKHRAGIDYLTHDIWRKFKNDSFAARRFSVPELGIDGGILEATRILHSIVWRYEAETEAEVEAIRSGFPLPVRYVGLHVRGGDKSLENEIYEPGRYIEKAESLTGLRDAFVLTDDYSTFELLVEEYPGWRFTTTCRPDEKGYFHEDHMRMDTAFKAERSIRLFAAMDLLAGSELFVGTFSSNPGMDLGMRMPAGRVFGLDYESWKIRW